MFTPREEYRAMLRALQNETAVSQWATNLGHSFFNDLMLLHSISEAHGRPDLFQQTLDRLRKLRVLTPQRMTAVISGSTRRAARLGDIQTNAYAYPKEWDIVALHRTYNTLQQMLDQPVAGREQSLQINEYIKRARELASKYSVSAQERAAYYDIMQGKAVSPALGETALTKAERLFNEITRLDDVLPKIGDISKARSALTDPWQTLQQRLRAAMGLRRKNWQVIQATRETLLSAIEEARLAFSDVGLEGARAPRDTTKPIIHSPLHGYDHRVFKGDPDNVQRAVEDALGLSNWQAETKRQAEMLASEIQQASALETIVGGQKRPAYGAEALRMHIGNLSRRTTGTHVPDYTEAWRQAYAQQQAIRVPGSMVPHRVSSISPATGHITLEPWSLKAGQIEAHLEIPQWTSQKEVRRMLQRLKVAQREIAAHTLIMPAEMQAMQKQAVRLLSDTSATETHLARIISQTLPEQASPQHINEFLREVAIVYAPWIQRTMSNEDIIHSSYLAFAEAARSRVADAAAKVMLNKDLVVELFSSREGQKDYARRLLHEVFAILPEQQGLHNITANMIDYIREQLPAISEGGVRSLSDIEAAEMLRRAAAYLGDDAPPYIRQLAKTPAGQIIAMARQGSAEFMPSLDYYWSLAEAGEAGETLADRLLAKLGNVASTGDPLEALYDKEVSRFFRRHHREIQRLVSNRSDMKRFAARYRRLKDAFAKEVQANTQVLDEVILEASRLPLTREGIMLPAKDMDITKIRDLLRLQKDTGGRMRVEFYRTVGERRTPIALALREEGIIGMDLVSRHRFVVGPINQITANTATKPVISKIAPEYAYAGPQYDVPPLVRSLGIPYHDLAMPVGHAPQDIPDVSLAAFQRLRSMRAGQKMGLAAVDWETTTLPGRGQPFYPTELGIVGEVLERTERGYRKMPGVRYRTNILIRPTEEVRQATERTIAKLLEGGSFHQNLDELRYLGNIAKFADQGAFKLAYDLADYIASGGSTIQVSDAQRLAEASRRGLSVLSEKGVALPVALRRMERTLSTIREHGGGLTLVGQNVLGAEYAWTRHFAELAGLNEQQLRSFTDSMDRFFRNRIDDIYLDRLMSSGRIQSSALEWQVQRYLEPVLKGQTTLKHGTGRMIKRMVPTLEVRHRAMEDALQEMAILYSHLGRDLPTGDPRMLQVGDYVVRERAGPVLDPYASAETGRPVRNVFRVTDIGQEGEHYALRLASLDVSAEKQLAPSGQTEVVWAANPLELSRRFHSEFRVLSDQQEALQMQQEILDDYARREVIKAVSSPYKFGELEYWRQHGIPSPDVPLEQTAIYQLLEEYNRFAMSDDAEIWQELLFGSGYGKQTTSPLVTGRLLHNEASMLHATRRRLQAWPAVQQWLTSEEGLAYRQIIDDIARARALGILDAKQVHVLSAVEAARKEFLTARGLTEHVRNRRDLFTTGPISVAGVSRELFVPGTSPREIHMRLSSFTQQIARMTEQSQDDIAMALKNVLAQRGLIGDTLSMADTAAHLYESVKAGKLRPALVEMRHLPVITTPELRQEFVEHVHRRALSPLFTIATPGVELSRAELDAIIAASPVLAARDVKYRTALQQLEEKGLAGMHLHPAVSIGPLPVSVAGTGPVEQVANVAFVQTLIQTSEGLRASGQPVYRGTLEKLGLSGHLERLYTDIYKEFGQEHQPILKALGWAGEHGDLGAARIPFFSRDFPGNLFMRQLKEFTPEQLRRLQGMFEYQESAIQRQTASLIDLYLRGMEKGQPETPLRAINEAIKEQAVQVATAAGTDVMETAATSAHHSVSGTIRNINESIKAQGAQVQGSSRAGISRWGLLAGIGLAAAMVGYVLTHRDKEKHTAAGAPAYERGSPSPREARSIRTSAPPVYRRPLMLEENDMGYRLKIKGRTDYPVNTEALGTEIHGALAGRDGWSGQININARHDASTVDEQFARDTFAKLLKQGYIT